MWGNNNHIFFTKEQSQITWMGVSISMQWGHLLFTWSRWENMTDLVRSRLWVHFQRKSWILGGSLSFQTKPQEWPILFWYWLCFSSRKWYADLIGQIPVWLFQAWMSEGMGHCQWQWLCQDMLYNHIRQHHAEWSKVPSLVINNNSRYLKIIFMS